MRFYGLDLNLLVVLDALLAEQNITRAGERLHLSQPATSAALARLRDYFKDDLLVQVGRKMVRTPVGESLTQPVRSLLIQMRSTLENNSEFKPIESSRKFVLMVSDYVGTVLMPQVSKHLNERAPMASLELIPPHDNPREAIDRGQIDLLILPESQLADDHPSEVLFEDEFVCVACQHNPLVGEKLSFEEYKHMGHVLVRWGMQRIPSIDEWFLNRFGFERRIEVSTNTFSGVAPFLIDTQRVATMHRRLAERTAHYLPLKIVPLPWEAPTLTMAMQWNKYQQRDLGLIWLRSLLIESAQALDKQTRLKHL